VVLVHQACPDNLKGFVTKLLRSPVNLFENSIISFTPYVVYRCGENQPGEDVSEVLFPEGGGCPLKKTLPRCRWP